MGLDAGLLLVTAQAQQFSYPYNVHSAPSSGVPFSSESELEDYLDALGAGLHVETSVDWQDPNTVHATVSHSGNVPLARGAEGPSILYLLSLAMERLDENIQNARIEKSDLKLGKIRFQREDCEGASCYFEINFGSGNIQLAQHTASPSNFLFPTAYAQRIGQPQELPHLPGFEFHGPTPTPTPSALNQFAKGMLHGLGEGLLGDAFIAVISAFASPLLAGVMSNPVTGAVFIAGIAWIVKGDISTFIQLVKSGDYFGAGSFLSQVLKRYFISYGSSKLAGGAEGRLIKQLEALAKNNSGRIGQFARRYLVFVKKVNIALNRKPGEPGSIYEGAPRHRIDGSGPKPNPDAGLGGGSGGSGGPRVPVIPPGSGGGAGGGGTATMTRPSTTTVTKPKTVGARDGNAPQPSQPGVPINKVNVPETQSVWVVEGGKVLSREVAIALPGEQQGNIVEAPVEQTRRIHFIQDEKSGKEVLPDQWQLSTELLENETRLQHIKGAESELRIILPRLNPEGEYAAYMKYKNEFDSGRVGHVHVAPVELWLTQGYQNRRPTGNWYVVGVQEVFGEVFTHAEAVGEKIRTTLPKEKKTYLRTSIDALDVAMGRNPRGADYYKDLHWGTLEGEPVFYLYNNANPKGQEINARALTGEEKQGVAKAHYDAEALAAQFMPNVEILGNRGPNQAPLVLSLDPNRPYLNPVQPTAPFGPQPANGSNIPQVGPQRDISDSNAAQAEVEKYANQDADLWGRILEVFMKPSPEAIAFLKREADKCKNGDSQLSSEMCLSLRLLFEGYPEQSKWELPDWLNQEIEAWIQRERAKQEAPAWAAAKLLLGVIEMLHAEFNRNYQNIGPLSPEFVDQVKAHLRNIETRCRQKQGRDNAVCGRLKDIVAMFDEITSPYPPALQALLPLTEEGLAGARSVAHHVALKMAGDVCSKLPEPRQTPAMRAFCQRLAVHPAAKPTETLVPLTPPVALNKENLAAHFTLEEAERIWKALAAITDGTFETRDQHKLRLWQVLADLTLLSSADHVAAIESYTKRCRGYRSVDPLLCKLTQFLNAIIRALESDLYMKVDEVAAPDISRWLHDGLPHNVAAAEAEDIRIPNNIELSQFVRDIVYDQVPQWVAGHRQALAEIYQRCHQHITQPAIPVSTELCAYVYQMLFGTWHVFDAQSPGAEDDLSQFTYRGANTIFESDDSRLRTTVQIVFGHLNTFERHYLMQWIWEDGRFYTRLAKLISQQDARRAHQEIAAWVAGRNAEEYPIDGAPAVRAQIAYKMRQHYAALWQNHAEDMRTIFQGVLAQDRNRALIELTYYPQLKADFIALVEAGKHQAARSAMRQFLQTHLRGPYRLDRQIMRLIDVLATGLKQNGKDKPTHSAQASPVPNPQSEAGDAPDAGKTAASEQPAATSTELTPQLHEALKGYPLMRALQTLEPEYFDLYYDTIVETFADRGAIAHLIQFLTLPLENARQKISEFLASNANEARDLTRTALERLRNTRVDDAVSRQVSGYLAQIEMGRSSSHPSTPELSNNINYLEAMFAPDRVNEVWSLIFTAMVQSAQAPNFMRVLERKPSREMIAFLLAQLLQSGDEEAQKVAQHIREQRNATEAAQIDHWFVRLTQASYRAQLFNTLGPIGDDELRLLCRGLIAQNLMQRFWDLMIQSDYQAARNMLFDTLRIHAIDGLRTLIDQIRRNQNVIHVDQAISLLAELREDSATYPQYMRGLAYIFIDVQAPYVLQVLAEIIALGKENPFKNALFKENFTQARDIAMAAAQRILDRSVTSSSPIRRDWRWHHLEDGQALRDLISEIKGNNRSVRHTMSSVFAQFNDAERLAILDFLVEAYLAPQFGVLLEQKSAIAVRHFLIQALSGQNGTLATLRGRLIEEERQAQGAASDQILNGLNQRAANNPFLQRTLDAVFNGLSPVQQQLAITALLSSGSEGRFIAMLQVGNVSGALALLKWAVSEHEEISESLPQLEAFTPDPQSTTPQRDRFISALEANPRMAESAGLVFGNIFNFPADVFNAMLSELVEQGQYQHLMLYLALGSSYVTSARDLILTRFHTEARYGNILDEVRAQRDRQNDRAANTEIEKLARQVAAERARDPQFDENWRRILGDAAGDATAIATVLEALVIENATDQVLSQIRRGRISPAATAIITYLRRMGNRVADLVSAIETQRDAQESARIANFEAEIAAHRGQHDWFDEVYTTVLSWLTAPAQAQLIPKLIRKQREDEFFQHLLSRDLEPLRELINALFERRGPEKPTPKDAAPTAPTRINTTEAFMAEYNTLIETLGGTHPAAQFFAGLDPNDHPILVDWLVVNGKADTVIELLRVANLAGAQIMVTRGLTGAQDPVLVRIHRHFKKQREENIKKDADAFENGVSTDTMRDENMAAVWDRLFAGLLKREIREIIEFLAAQQRLNALRASLNEAEESVEERFKEARRIVLLSIAHAGDIDLRRYAQILKSLSPDFDHADASPEVTVNVRWTPHQEAELLSADQLLTLVNQTSGAREGIFYIYGDVKGSTLDDAEIAQALAFLTQSKDQTRHRFETFLRSNNYVRARSLLQQVLTHIDGAKDLVARLKNTSSEQGTSPGQDLFALLQEQGNAIALFFGKDAAWDAEFITEAQAIALLDAYLSLNQSAPRSLERRNRVLTDVQEGTVSTLRQALIYFLSYANAYKDEEAYYPLREQLSFINAEEQADDFAQAEVENILQRAAQDETFGENLDALFVVMEPGIQRELLFWYVRPFAYKKERPLVTYQLTGTPTMRTRIAKFVSLLESSQIYEARDGFLSALYRKGRNGAPARASYLTPRAQAELATLKEIHDDEAASGPSARPAKKTAPQGPPAQAEVQETYAESLRARHQSQLDHVLGTVSEQSKARLFEFLAQYGLHRQAFEAALESRNKTAAYQAIYDLLYDLSENYTLSQEDKNWVAAIWYEMNYQVDFKAIEGPSSQLTEDDETGETDLNNLPAGETGEKEWTVVVPEDIQEALDDQRFNDHIRKRFAYWKGYVAVVGVDGLKKGNGFNDKQYHSGGQENERRSYLTPQWRVKYRYDHQAKRILVIDVIQKNKRGD